MQLNLIHLEIVLILLCGSKTLAKSLLELSRLEILCLSLPPQRYIYSVSSGPVSVAAPDVGIAAASASPLPRKFGPRWCWVARCLEIKFLNTKVCVFSICWKSEF